MAKVSIQRSDEGLEAIYRVLSSNSFNLAVLFLRQNIPDSSQVGIETFFVSDSRKRVHGYQLLEVPSHNPSMFTTLWDVKEAAHLS